MTSDCRSLTTWRLREKIEDGVAGHPEQIGFKRPYVPYLVAMLPKGAKDIVGNVVGLLPDANKTKRKLADRRRVADYSCPGAVGSPCFILSSNAFSFRLCIVRRQAVCFVAIVANTAILANLEPE